ncbi:MAG: S41 family peptidase, partial [Planctomycetota bacterium]
MPRLKTEIVILAILVGVFVGRIPDTFAIKSNAYDFFGTLVDIRSEVVRNYVTEPDHEALLSGAIGGMIESLEDPYTTYLSPKSFQDFDKHTSGTFIGIGAEIAVTSNIGAQLKLEDGALVFGALAPDLPAHKGGIMEGDVLTHIDDEPVEGLTPEKALQRVAESRNDPAVTV